MKYPDRLATQIMNGRELSSLDGLGMVGMEEQQQNILKEQQRQVMIVQQANREGSTFEKFAINENTNTNYKSQRGRKPNNKS